MKSQPFFLLRWWRSLMLQTRLFLAFTFLFVFCILALSLLLNNVIQMMRINQQTQTIFEQNRLAYRLKTVVDQYQLALQSYENSETDRSFSLAEQALYTSNEQIYRSLSLLVVELDEEEMAQFDQFISSSDQLTEITDQVIQAVADEDWDTVVALDDQANALIEEMNLVVDHFQDTGNQRLQAADDETEMFNLLSLLTTLVVLPVFLLLAGLVALVIYQQINQPLYQLADASQAVLADKFQPQMLEKLAARSDEIGVIARRFVQMAAAVSERSVLLRQEANAIRARIR
jgi:hypothetical protein